MRVRRGEAWSSKACVEDEEEGAAVVGGEGRDRGASSSSTSTTEPSARTDVGRVFLVVIVVEVEVPGCTEEDTDEEYE